MRLRRATLLAAPLFLLGAIAATATVSLGLWAVWHPEDLGTLFVASVVVSASVAVAAFVARSGCFVELDAPGPPDAALRDVVAWRTVHRVPRQQVVTVRVRAGAWRWFELELDDGSLVTLVGACPVQFPARLAPDARLRDLADLDLLLGDADA